MYQIFKKWLGNGTLLFFSWKDISKRFMLVVYFHCVFFFSLTLNLMISSLDKIMINDWIRNWVRVNSSHFGSLFSVKCSADPCRTRLHYFIWVVAVARRHQLLGAKPIRGNNSKMLLQLLSLLAQTSQNSRISEQEVYLPTGAGWVPRCFS